MTPSRSAFAALLAKDLRTELRTMRSKRLSEALSLAACSVSRAACASTWTGSGRAANTSSAEA